MWFYMMDYCELHLPDGTPFLVDVSDFPKIFNYSWHLHKNKKGKIYVRGWEPLIRKKVMLHRLLLNAEDPDLVVDHINGNTLDNRKSNLRIATVRQNSANCRRYKNNSSGYKGVSFDKSTNLWKAYIGGAKSRKHLGSFLTKEDAAKAYNREASILYGEFARLNDV